jgi:hypothetical protein
MSKNSLIGGWSLEVERLKQQPPARDLFFKVDDVNVPVFRSSIRRHELNITYTKLSQSPSHAFHRF